MARGLGRRSTPHESPVSQFVDREQPSIAVLAFQNLSDEPQQQYFADGMVEDIITGLSRIRWLFVIARNSSFTYKGRCVDVRQVGRELGVRYIIEGGVRKVDNRVRISVQLVEAATGAHLWADKFDGNLSDVFDLQDQITDKIVAIIEPSVQRSEIERSRRKHPENLDAYDLYLRAVPYTASQMPNDARTAMRYLQDALQIDPNYAAAHAMIAWCYEWCFTRAGFNDADRVAALAHASAAIVSSTDDAATVAIAGFVTTLLSKNHQAGLIAAQRALALNPSCATALYMGALTNAFSGHPGNATRHAERALRLSPFDLLSYMAHLAQGLAAMQERRYEDASSFFTAALQANPSLSSLRFCEAIALVMSGRIDTARASLQYGLEVEPGFRLRLFRELMVREVADRLAEGGAVLGLPD